MYASLFINQIIYINDVTLYVMKDEIKLKLIKDIEKRRHLMKSRNKKVSVCPKGINICAIY